MLCRAQPLLPLHAGGCPSTLQLCTSGGVALQLRDSAAAMRAWDAAGRTDRPGAFAVIRHQLRRSGGPRLVDAGECPARSGRAKTTLRGSPWQIQRSAEPGRQYDLSPHQYLKFCTFLTSMSTKRSNVFENGHSRRVRRGRLENGRVRPIHHVRSVLLVKLGQDCSRPKRRESGGLFAQGTGLTRSPDPELQ